MGIPMAACRAGCGHPNVRGCGRARAEVALMSLPPFCFRFWLEVRSDNNDYFFAHQGRAQSEGFLNLAFDGVALTFVSSLYLFMLHGIAPGCFIGCCAFAASRVHGGRLRAEEARKSVLVDEWLAEH